MTIRLEKRSMFAKFNFVVRNPKRTRIGSDPIVLIMLSVAKKFFDSFSPA